MLSKDVSTDVFKVLMYDDAIVVVSTSEKKHVYLTCIDNV